MHKQAPFAAFIGIDWADKKHDLCLWVPGNVRYKAAIERRIEAIRSECPLTTDLAVIEPMCLLVQALLGQLRAASVAIARFDE